jgi:hypothetical protein
MNGAAHTTVDRVRPQERTCLGKFIEYASVRVKMQLVRVYPYPLPLTGILVAYKKLRFTDLLFYGKNGSEIAAAFTALEAFKAQNNLPAYFSASYLENIGLRL